MFLAERVCKKWNEDFVDEDTQEIVSIERNQILFDRDEAVDSKMVKDIEEYGITEIVVTNTPGRADMWVDGTNNKEAWVKKRKFVCWAHDIKDARSIVTAWIKKDTETEVGSNNRETLVIVAANPFTVHTYLPAAVCNEYITNEELKLKTEDE